VSNTVCSTSPATGRGVVSTADELEVVAPPPHAAMAVAAASAAVAIAARYRIHFVVPMLTKFKTPLQFRDLMTATAQSTVPAVGETAPDFTLPSTSGEKITLSALRGKPVLLAFFPLAFSGTCTAELCEMRDDHEQFAGRGVTVLPISVDHTYSLKEYKAKHGMHIDLVSDFMRDVSRKYGVLLEDRGYANRSYFLIDKDGVIRWEHVETQPGQRRLDAELFAEIDKLA
jgi:peroxiredoxin